MQGFIDRFPMPVSRYTENKKDEKKKSKKLVSVFLIIGNIVNY